MLGFSILFQVRLTRLNFESMEAVAELEKVKGNLLHNDEVSVLQDIMRIKEDEIRDLKSALESISDAHENNLKEQKLNYSHQIEEFHEKLKQQKMPISQLEKHTDQLGNEREEVSQELATLQVRKFENDKWRKQQESQLMDLQSQPSECYQHCVEVLVQPEKDRGEPYQLRRAREDEEQLVSNLNRKIAALQKHLDKVTNKVDTFEGIHQLRTQPAEIQNEAEERVMERVKEIRKKKITNVFLLMFKALLLQFRLCELEKCQHLLEESEAAKERLAQEKKKLKQEIGEAKIELENVCAASREMEKMQRKLEKQLAEERENVIRERDAHVQKLRSSKATILSLRNELRQLNETIDEKERVRRMLQLELNESIPFKSDVEKNVHELETSKRHLEQTIHEQRVVIEDLEDKLRLFEDARVRLEANIQALRAEKDITPMAKDLLAEVKSLAQSRTRAEVAALGAKIRNLEKQNGVETRKRQEAMRQIRCNVRATQMLRQLDEKEGELRRERAESTIQRQEIDDLTEVNDTLTRGNSRLR
uniref:Myosin_tail_1 domain-containing protein n=1 Tax=Angiostrongylus cantonensis TaxID=6313 RepID=A0A0K0D3W2_ANGCA